MLSAATMQMGYRDSKVFTTVRGRKDAKLAHGTKWKRLVVAIEFNICMNNDWFV